MSDFLSNFNKDSYKETKEKKQQTKQEERLQKQEPLPRNVVDKPAETFVEPANDFQAADEIIPTMSRSQVDSETQIDPTYHQKRKKSLY